MIVKTRSMNKLNLVKCICNYSKTPLAIPFVSEDKSSANLKSWKEIPGPSGLPIIGQLHHFFPGGSLFKSQGYDMWNRLYKAYGRIVRLETILKPTVLILYDPEFIAQIFHGENWSPLRPAFFTLKYFRKVHNRTKEESLRPAGLAIDQGEEWKDMRMKVNPVLMMPNIVKLYRDAIEKVAVDMVKRVKSIRDDKNMIRECFAKEMNLWSLESIGVVALGRRLNCFDPNLKQDSPAMILIQRTHELFEISDKLEYKPSIWKYYATPTFNRAMEAYADIETSTAYYIKIAMKDIKAGIHREEEEKSVLEKLLEIDETTAHTMVADMLIAGVDTTSNTVLSTLYLLAKHPEKQQKVRAEITSKGKGPYLKACLKESLRLMPTVGLNFRVTTKEYNMLGYKIPKDMGIIFCHHVISLKDYYYPMAKKFIPERWLVDEEHPLHYRKTHPFVHQPFGFGVRSCIGRRIAELEMETLLARLVENFEIDWVGPPPEVTFSHINYMRGPYNFVFNDVK